MPVHPATAEALLAEAKALAPMIAEHRDAIERERGMPLPIVRAMQDIGIIRMSVPRSYGGLELDPEAQFAVLEALSMADASVGWCAFIGGGAGYFSAFLDEAVAREVLADPDAITAGALRPAGRAEAVPGGYRVGGRWPFASGARHSAWMFAGCMVYEGHEPRRGAQGRPATLVCVLPTKDCTLIDTWFSTGLHGSGSVDFSIENAFVPESRTFSLADSPIRLPGPLYRLWTMFIANHSAVILGLARAAIDAVLGLATGKTRVTGTGLRDELYAQASVGRAEALVSSARAYCLAVLGDIMGTTRAGEEPSMRQRANLRLSVFNAHAAAIEAVNLMYHVGGGTSAYAASPLDRLLRDAHTINQHLVAAPKWPETAGRVFLGLDSGVPLL
jgi:alkylation response protein AidB-like acyl-CoA dehydrogenase